MKYFLRLTVKANKRRRLQEAIEDYLNYCKQLYISPSMQLSVITYVYHEEELKDSAKTKLLKKLSQYASYLAHKDIAKTRLERKKTVIMPYQIAQLIYDLELKLKSYLQKGQTRLIARDLATYILALTGCRPCEAAQLAVHPLKNTLVKSKQVHSSSYYHKYNYQIVRFSGRAKTSMIYGFLIPKYADMDLLRNCGKKAMASWKGKQVSKLTSSVCESFRNRSEPDEMKYNSQSIRRFRGIEYLALKTKYDSLSQEDKRSVGDGPLNQLQHISDKTTYQYYSRLIKKSPAASYLGSSGHMDWDILGVGQRIEILRGDGDPK